MKTCKYFLAFFILFHSVQMNGQPGAYRRITITAAPELVKSWQQQDILPSHFHYDNGMLEMELDTVEMNIFRQRGIVYRDISDSFYRQTRAGGNNYVQRLQSVPANFTLGSMGGYYTYAEAMNVLDEMHTKFPSLASAKDTLGYTYEGRPIVAVRISDNPDVHENNEDEWLMTGLHHANEVIGEQIVIYFAWYLLEHYDTDKEIRNLLNNSALYIIPVLNPDGLAFNESTNPAGGGSWRKNRKPRVISGTTHYGIDLNRNYGLNWGYTHPGQLGQAGSNFAGNVNYRGTAAWSEAETKAVRDLCNEHRFTSAINYHAWDDSFNYPWNFDIDSLTPDSIRYFDITQYCIGDNHFETGTFNRTLGYTANGTSDDWLYGEQATKNKIFAFTIEVGKSFWPAESLIYKYCDSLLQANIKMMRMAAKYAAVQETSMDTIRSLSHYIAYNIKRYSSRDTGFTVSVIPLEADVISSDPAKLYSDLSFLEIRADTIRYSLSPVITNGTILHFVIKVDNGMWYITDTISKVFWGHSVLPLDCTDNAEPNNTATQATVILPGQYITGSIQERQDEDWFYFENTADKRNIRIILSDLPADYDMELVEASGQRMFIANRPYKFNDTIVFNTSQTGIYRIRVYGYERSYHPFHCYQLKVELGSSPFESAGYSSYKDKSNEEIGLSVYPTPAKDNISVAVKAGSSQDISWILSDNTGRKLNSGTRRINGGMSVFPINLAKLPAGIYLVQVITASGKVVSAKIVRE